MSCKDKHGSPYAAVRLRRGAGGGLIMLCQYGMHDAAAIHLYTPDILCRLP